MRSALQNGTRRIIDRPTEVSVKVPLTVRYPGSIDAQNTVLTLYTCGWVPRC